MNRLFTLFFTICMMVQITVNAQRIYEITTDAANPTDISAVIAGDTLDNGSRVDLNTIYTLDNNGIYLILPRFRPNYPIRLHAKDTSNKALKPYLTRIPVGTNYTGAIWGEDNIELINLEVNLGYNGPLADPAPGSIRLQSDSTRLIIKDCIMNGDRAGFPRLGANGCKVYIENTIMRNGSNRGRVAGNGRSFEARNYSIDSLVVRNSVIHNYLDRVFRSVGAVSTHNYIEYDHTTIFNHVGRHGAFCIGYGAKTLKFTNNIFENPNMLGVSAIYNDEQTQVDSDNKFIIAVDGDQNRVDSLGSKFMFDNNNFYWTQDVLDYYASNDSVSRTGIYSQEIVRRMGGAAIADTTYFSEVLQFNTVPMSAFQYVKDVYVDPTNTSMFDIIVEASNIASVDPDNYGNYENLFDFSTFDVGYSTESTSYTAATDGGAIGARFGSFGLPEVILGVETNLVETILVYPNPTNGPATFRYNLENNEEVHMTLMDVNGRELGVLDSGPRAAGTHNIQVDLSKFITSQGIYFTKFTSESKTKIMRLVYVK